MTVAMSHSFNNDRSSVGWPAVVCMVAVRYLLSGQMLLVKGKGGIMLHAYLISVH